MPKSKNRHMFPGGNTSLGFYSYYNYIIDPEKARRIFVIKGGPGVGKSTFMKKIAKEMEERGFTLEFMHCSSDPNSLDGLVITDLQVALLDGTAPHVVDPKNPGAVDEIIHLGDYWNEAGIVANKEKIIKDNKEVGRLFDRAYRYIKAAAAIYEDSSLINSWAIDTAKANIAAGRIVDELFQNKVISERAGKQRHLFASAITPLGLINYLSILMDKKNVYVIKGNSGTGTEKLLEKVRDAADVRGFDTESYYCALIPSKLEHLVIPELDVSFTSDNEYHRTGINSELQVDFNSFIDKDIINRYEQVLQYNKERFEELLHKAIATIKEAKALHDHMESYYIPNMDFEAVQRCLEATCKRILEYDKLN